MHLTISVLASVNGISIPDFRAPACFHDDDAARFNKTVFFLPFFDVINSQTIITISCRFNFVSHVNDSSWCSQLLEWVLNGLFTVGEEMSTWIDVSANITTKIENRFFEAAGIAISRVGFQTGVYTGLVGGLIELWAHEWESIWVYGMSAVDQLDCF